MEPLELPIEDVLDLHTFKPRDIPDLLPEYLTACKNKGIFSVRIIHGKGKGILKKHVHEILSKSLLVKSFKDAPAEAGSWGATIVELYR